MQGFMKPLNRNKSCKEILKVMSHIEIHKSKLRLHLLTFSMEMLT